MSSKINSIPYWPDATGYTGIICGQYYGLSDPQDFLNVANRNWPRLLFKLELRNEKPTRTARVSKTDEEAML